MTLPQPIDRCTPEEYLRREHEALRRGKYRRLLAQGMVYAFARRTDRELLVVLLNAGHTNAVAEIPVGEWLQDGTRVEAVWQTRQTHAIDGGYLRGLKLPARTGEVFRAQF